MSNRRGSSSRFNLHNDLAPPPEGRARDREAEDERQIVQLARDHLNDHINMLADRPTINACLQSNNRRFPQIVCFDETRFIYPNEPEAKFYHAQRCDGFEQADAYIVAQAPFSRETRQDFWQMCCFERPVAIVVMDDDAGKETAIVENFWPQVGAQLSYPNDRGRRFLEVGCADHREAKDGTYHAYILELAVYGIQDVTRARTTMYLMRPEPSSVPTYLPQLRMELIAHMYRVKRRRPMKGYVPPGPKIMLVCGDGVTKAASFVAFDVIMDRAGKTDRVGLKQTVSVLKKQCYGAIKTFDNYRKLHALLLSGLKEGHHTKVKK